MRIELIPTNRNGVKGFPTIKHGDPSALEDYKGARDYNSFANLAKDLKPMCSPTNIQLCDEESKSKIEEFKAMGKETLDSAIKGLEEKIEGFEQTLKSEVEKLQAQYKKLLEEKDEKIAAVKKEGLGLMKAVRAAIGTEESKDEL